MLPLLQADRLTSQRHDSTLANAQRIQDYKRFIRKGRGHDALERFTEVDIQSGSNLGRLNQEMFTVLHRVAE
jgi:hypothetical protein